MLFGTQISGRNLARPLFFSFVLLGALSSGVVKAEDRCAEVGRAFGLVVSRYFGTLEHLSWCRADTSNHSQLKRAEIAYLSRNEDLFRSVVARSIHAAHGCEETVDVEATLKELGARRVDDPALERFKLEAKRDGLVGYSLCNPMIRQIDKGAFDILKTQDTLDAVNYIFDSVR